MFITREILSTCGWQAFERIVARLLIHKGYSGVRVVGGSGDKGADILARSPNGKRWLIQAKYWAKPVPEIEMQRTLEGARTYRANLSVIVALNGVDEKARAFQKSVQLLGQSISVWEPNDLLALASKLPMHSPARSAQGKYQESAIQAVCEMIEGGSPRRSMVIMATGLGKTFVAAESIRRASTRRKLKVLVIAHTNQLVLQLEKAFWPFIGPQEPTSIWNQHEKPTESALKNHRFVFASRDSLSNFLSAGGVCPRFDLVVIDECHHAHSNSSSYQNIINQLGAGTNDGPQLLGLTATPFLADPEARLEPVFGDNPLVRIDMIYGLQNGFLSQIDYRLFTDNINWEGLKSLAGTKLSPKAVNRAFFIKEWDDGVISELRKSWHELDNPKAIVFCGTIDHAILMKDKINSLGFCKADAIYSGNARGNAMSQYQRNLLLSDFEAGVLNVMCTVDVFNEGIDVPDVNIVVFNRVTHSRRIFIQQLGRGLRLSAGKSKAIVLDFAQDIRRFAAGLNMKTALEKPPAGSVITLGNKVIFRNASGEDQRAESFLRAWLEDAQAIEGADDDDAGILKFPPDMEARHSN
jgi:superfamily II DNA or RNA helicase